MVINNNCNSEGISIGPLNSCLNVTSSKMTPFTLLRLTCLSLCDRFNTFHSPKLAALHNILWSSACPPWGSDVLFYFSSHWHFSTIPKGGSLRWLLPHPRRVLSIHYFQLLVPLSVILVTSSNNLYLLSYLAEHFTQFHLILLAVL